MRALIFANGVITEYDWLKVLISDDDYLICADGGTYHCLTCGRIPHVVVGDLDSLELEIITLLKKSGIPLESHPAVKNETDLELAINVALRPATAQNTITEILLVGVLGGRLDQMLSNLLILVQREWPMPLHIVDRNESAQLVRGGETVTVYGKVGDTLSAIPLSHTVSDITYAGLLYPLQNATLQMGSTQGVSNEFAHERATISVGTGSLLLVHRHGSYTRTAQ